MLAGIIQLSSTRDVERNLQKSRELAAQAAAQGAKWLLYPENAPYLGKDREKLSVAETIDGPIVKAYQEIAKTHGCWVTLGSFPEKSESPKHTYNTQLLIQPNGELASVYRKMHLFDVELEDGTILEESASILGGDTIELADVEADGESFCVGLSICYDLRFPQLYRTLAQAGAEILICPAAFTKKTGEAHWHVLNRARAIETTRFVISACAIGPVPGGGECYGHSLVVSPWGEVISDGGTIPGVVQARIDLDAVAEAAGRVPSLTNDQPFTLSHTSHRSVA